MFILNLGCGTKASSYPGCVNIDWSVYLRLKKNIILRIIARPFFLNGYRLDRLRSLPDNIYIYNLAKGIPYPEGSVDVCYHSHLLEHLDRDVAVAFTKEVFRVLKPGGVLRISVPDFERYARDYVKCLDQNDFLPPSQVIDTDLYIDALIGQSVMRDSSGTVRQNRLVRLFEKLFLGDARKRGYTHQWMYDRYSLRRLLESVGFEAYRKVNYNESLLEDWANIALDSNPDGTEYLYESLYVEAVKPVLSR
jgi:predicted SAM-dependent methyltransferase